MPRFSIVIPTRNRHDWLGQSIAAALEQDFDDYEVLIADNSDLGESPTAAVVREYDSPRIRYHRTGGLSMAQNWQAAVEAAHGDYFIICSDKLLLAPGLLRLLDRCIRNSDARVVVWKLGAVHQRQMLGDSIVEGHLVPGKEIWECAASGAWRIFQNAGARGMNSAIDRRLVREVENRLGVPFCRPATPDYMMAISLAALGVDSFYLDLVGASFLPDAHGTGMLALMAPDDATVRRQFDVPQVTDLPVRFATGTNLIYQDICSLNRLLPQADRRAVNWEMYFVHLIHESSNADDLGGFGAARRRELAKAIRLHPIRFRLSLAKTVLLQEVHNLFRRKYAIRFHLLRLWRFMKYTVPALLPGRRKAGLETS